MGRVPRTFEEIFGEDPDPADEKYPGSKRSRRERPPATNHRDESWRTEYTTKLVAGKERRFYTVRALAAACGVTTHSIKLWTENGYIPNAPYRLPDMVQGDGTTKPGRKLYSEAMVEALADVLVHYGVLGSKRIPWKQNPQITEDILRAWDQIKAREDMVGIPYDS